MPHPSVAATYLNRRMLALLGLGFASGMPNVLTQATLQAWMRNKGIDLGVIGLFSAVTIPYALKFIWAPIVDRYQLPFLGRRRGWLLVTQLLLVIAIAAMAFSGPKDQNASLSLFFLISLGVAFLSATQDIVADAYRTEVLAPSELGAGAAVFVTGYRVGLIASGAGALELSERLNWPTVYLVMVTAMGVGLAATLIAPAAPKTTAAPTSLKRAIVEPFVSFFSRNEAVLVLFFVVLFKLPDVMARVMTLPMLIDLGFSNADVGRVQQGLGLGISILGAFVGGGLIAKTTMVRSLWIVGILQVVSNLGFLVLAMVGRDYAAMVAVIAIENFCGGLVTAAFVAFLMSQCDHRYTAFQYALLTSLMAMTGSLGGAPSGYVVNAMGYAWFFAVTIIAGIPGLILLLWMRNPPNNLPHQKNKSSV